MEDQEEIVKVGSKPKSIYINSALYSVDHCGRAVIRGLGDRQALVLEIAEALGKINGVKAEAPRRIEVNGSNGIEVKVFEKEKGVSL